MAFLIIKDESLALGRKLWWSLMHTHRIQEKTISFGTKVVHLTRIDHLLIKSSTEFFNKLGNPCEEMRNNVLKALPNGCITRKSEVGQCTKLLGTNG